MSADREPTAPEVLEWRRDDVFLAETDGNTEEFSVPAETSRPDSSSAVWPDGSTATTAPGLVPRGDPRGQSEIQAGEERLRAGILRVIRA